MTDEALERLEKNVSRRNELKMEWTTCYTHDASALLASYRALRSENRIAMRALELSVHRGGGYFSELPNELVMQDYLAEARAQEGK